MASPSESDVWVYSSSSDVEGGCVVVKGGVGVESCRFLERGGLR